MIKIGIILSEGFEEIEAVSTIDILRRGNCKVEIYGLGCLRITGAHGITIECDEIFDKYSLPDYDGIVFVGGMKNAISLSNDEDVLNLISEYVSLGKMVAGICATPSIVFAKTGVLKNKECTCYPSMELIANLNDAKYIDNDVVVCNNIITSQSPSTATKFALEILKYFDCNYVEVEKELKGNI